MDQREAQNFVHNVCLKFKKKKKKEQKTEMLREIQKTLQKNNP